MPDKNRSAAGHPAPKPVRDEGPAEVAGGNIDGAKRRGFILYPGKLTEVETFRVGCIGAIGRHEMSQAVNAAAETLREMGIPDGRPAA